MRNASRIDGYCDKLKEIWKKTPDWRFGQLICNYFSEVYSKTQRDIFYIEDAEMFEELDKCFRGEEAK